MTAPNKVYLGKLGVHAKLFKVIESNHVLYDILLVSLSKSIYMEKNYFKMFIVINEFSYTELV